MSEPTISVCTIVNGDEFYLEMMVESIKDYVDEIIIIDNGNSNKDIVELSDKIIYVSDCDFNSNLGEGRQKAYLHANSDWILWLDADEVIHENHAKQFKSLIKQLNENNIDSAHLEYIHFVENFSKIDNSEPVHMGLLRLHKNYKGISLNHTPNHTLPKCDWKKTIFIDGFHIWHLGYLRGMDKIRERFNRNMHFSELHTPAYMKQWRDWHYFGNYPTKPINPEMIPQVIKDKFLMEW